jgi:hypothetical protein
MLLFWRLGLPVGVLWACWVKNGTCCGFRRTGMDSQRLRSLWNRSLAYVSTRNVLNLVKRFSFLVGVHCTTHESTLKRRGHLYRIWESSARFLPKRFFALWCVLLSNTEVCIRRGYHLSVSRKLGETLFTWTRSFQLLLDRYYVTSVHAWCLT